MRPSIFSCQTSECYGVGWAASTVFFPFLPWGNYIKVKLATAHQAFKPWILSKLRAAPGVVCLWQRFRPWRARKWKWSQLRFCLWNLTRPSCHQPLDSAFSNFFLTLFFFLVNNILCEIPSSLVTNLNSLLYRNLCKSFLWLSFLCLWIILCVIFYSIFIF